MLLRTQAPVDPEPDRKVVLADSTKDALRSWRVDLAAVTIDCCSVRSWPSTAATPGPEDTLYLAVGGGEGHHRGAARRRRIEADLKKVVLPRAGGRWRVVPVRGGAAAGDARAWYDAVRDDGCSGRGGLHGSARQSRGTWQRWW